MLLKPSGEVCYAFETYAVGDFADAAGAGFEELCSALQAQGPDQLGW